MTAPDAEPLDDEAGFAALIRRRYSGDFTTMLVYADWLDERGDPRAAGYRWVAANRLKPAHYDIRGRPWTWWNAYAEVADAYGRTALPPHVWKALTGVVKYDLLGRFFADFPDLYAAYDAAARAFGGLRPRALRAVLRFRYEDAGR